MSGQLMGDDVTVVFTGYAPVHFACFEPLYRHLASLAGVRVVVSGGTRMMTPHGVRYDHELLYEPFGLPADVVVPVEALKDLDADAYFSAHTGRIAPRSYTRSVQLFHGMSFRNLAIREEAEGFDHYFLIGPYMERGFVSRGIFEADDRRGVRIGFPKTDRLINGDLDRQKVLAEHGLSGDRPVIVYAPTGAKGNSLETIGPEVLRRLGSEDYDILIKLHDHPKGWVDWFEALAPLEGPHLRIVWSVDVIPLLFIADLLITDASSVANEFTLLDRPIVFLDVPLLIEEATRTGAMVDLDTWGRKAGDLVTDPVDAAGVVAKALSDPGRHAEVRHAMVDDLFFNPGRATQAAASWLGEQLHIG